DYWHAGERFQTRLLGLAYFDCSSGKSVMIAETRPSLGQIDPAQPGQVTYPEAFDGISASVRFSYKKSAFSQDILLLKQLDSPAQWSLNPDACRIQVWTEMFDWPEPTFQKTSYLPQNGEPASRANWIEPNFPDQ